MARGVPQLATFLQVSTRAGDVLRARVRARSRRGRTATLPTRLASIEVGRIANQPVFGQFTLRHDRAVQRRRWREAERPRVELVLASTLDRGCLRRRSSRTWRSISARREFFPEPGMMVRDVVGAPRRAGDLSQRLPHVYMRSPRAVGPRLPLDDGRRRSRSRRSFPSARTSTRCGVRRPAEFEASLAQRTASISRICGAPEGSSRASRRRA